jgi:tetratricopeptide (TPR) repeat protein
MEKRLLVVMTILALFSASLFSASQDLTAYGKKNLRSANLHLKEGRPEKALPLYETVLQENPHNIEAMNNLAAIYYDTNKDYKKAHEYFTLTLQEINDVFTEYETLKESDEKAAKKFYKREIKKKDLTEMQERTPKFIQSCWIKLFNDAQEDFNAENYEISLDKFIYVYDLGPDSVVTMKMLAYNYMKLNDEENSLVFLEKVAENDLTDGMVRTQIGNTYFERGDYETASKWYNKAIEINPDNVDNYFNLAITYTKLKDQENTLSAYEKVLEFEPENLDALLYASNIHATLGNLDKSIEYLKKAIEVEPGNADRISFLAFKLAQEKRWDEALKYATMWKEIDQESTEAQNLINLANQNLK